MRRRFGLAAGLLGLAMAAASAEEATQGIFAGHGIVKAVAPATGALTLAHDDIKGFMPAMEMMYRVASPELSRDLKPGDEVDFKIDAAKYLIVEVTRLGRGK